MRSERNNFLKFLETYDNFSRRRIRNYELPYLLTNSDRVDEKREALQKFREELLNSDLKESDKKTYLAEVDKQLGYLAKSEDIPYWPLLITALAGCVLGFFGRGKLQQFLDEYAEDLVNKILKEVSKSESG